MNDATDERYTRLEARLARLERALGLDDALTPAPAAVAAPAPPAAAPIPTAPQSPRPAAASRSASNLMGWGAALSFVLAALYFIKLIHAAGWLTPERQLAIAVAVGVGLVATGLWLARYDRRYAAYLPAAGIVVLYLATYGAHLYYQLISARFALGAVAAISIAAMALGAHFRRSAYAVLAGLCVYLTPLVMDTVRATLLELTLYFTAWSLVFCYCALYERRRLTYLVPLYLAFLCFDAAWRLADTGEWQFAAIYQFTQFLIFAATAAWFSRRHAQPLTSEDAFAHALPLLYFYVSEYLLIRGNAPALAPLIALASAGLLLAIYLGARRGLGRADKADPPSAVLVSAYCSLVSAHVLFFEYLPTRYLPWAALALTPVLVGLARQPRPQRPVLVPVWLTCGGLLLLGFALLLLPDLSQHAAPAPLAALAAYALLLYAVYFVPGSGVPGSLASGVLYAAHGAAMVLVLRLFDGALAVSIAWALLAVATMLLALKREDRILGQSALVIFGASALKVLLFDLSGSAPVIRIGVLVVLGSSLYAGGWLYQGLLRRTVVLHPDATINAQLTRIATLCAEGLNDEGIVDRLRAEGVACLAKEGWHAALVAQIRRDYSLG